MGLLDTDSMVGDTPSTETSAVSIRYLEMASLGVPALMCFFCLRYLADGMSYTRPALLIAISAWLRHPGSTASRL